MALRKRCSPAESPTLADGKPNPLYCAKSPRCEHHWHYDFRVNRRRYRGTTELDRVASRFWRQRPTYAPQWADTKRALVTEIAVRLEQCDRCIKRVRSLERRYRGWRARAPRVSLTREATPRERSLITRADSAKRALTDEIWILTESFYHLASRALMIAQHPSGLGWKRFDVASVRIVRNQLIVHPEKPGGVMALNFSHDLGATGPVLKLFGSGRRPVVEGLFVHAGELADAFNKRLDKIDAEQAPL